VNASFCFISASFCFIAAISSCCSFTAAISSCCFVGEAFGVVYVATGLSKLTPHIYTTRVVFGVC
jgi:hypothetical protein